MKAMRRLIFGVSVCLLALVAHGQPQPGSTSGGGTVGGPPIGGGSAPVGSGVVMLLGLAAGYGVRKGLGNCVKEQE